MTIYANIHPIAQISIGVEYYTEPSKIYGALYQRVTTYWEYGRTGKEKVLARPKSPILRVPILILNYTIFI